MKLLALLPVVMALVACGESRTEKVQPIYIPATLDLKPTAAPALSLQAMTTIQSWMNLTPLPDFTDAVDLALPDPSETAQAQQDAVNKVNNGPAALKQLADTLSSSTGPCAVAVPKSSDDTGSNFSGSIASLPNASCPVSANFSQTMSFHVVSADQNLGTVDATAAFAEDKYAALKDATLATQFAMVTAKFAVSGNMNIHKTPDQMQTYGTFVIAYSQTDASGATTTFTGPILALFNANSDGSVIDDAQITVDLTGVRAGVTFRLFITEHQVQGQTPDMHYYLNDGEIPASEATKLIPGEMDTANLLDLGTRN